MNAAILVLMVGLPACGKTTCRVRWALEGFPGVGILNAVLLSLDAFRSIICGYDYREEIEATVGAWAEQTGRYLLATGQSVILDATSLRRGLRAKWIRMARQYHARVVVYDFSSVNLAVCTVRNEERDRKVPQAVLERMARELEAPSLEEGMDKLIRIGPDGRVMPDPVATTA